MKKLAIIGASWGQKRLCEKAREMGLYTIGFAWEDGAVCKDLFSKFYPISIMEKDKIIEICKKEKVDGVVSTASEITTDVACYIAKKLGLKGNNYENLIKFRNKYETRRVTNSISGLTSIKTLLVNDVEDISFYPCIIKPCRGSGKSGVFYAESKEKAKEALNYAKEVGTDVVVEEFVGGKEISVESISYNGRHKAVVIIDRTKAETPHFVDTEFSIPTTLSNDMKNRIFKLVPKILDAIKFKNGPSHFDMKICGDKIYLIEANLRGIGGISSSLLIQNGIDFDYTKAIIDVALDDFEFPSNIRDIKHVNSILLCKQSEKEYNAIKRNRKIIAENVYRNETIYAKKMSDMNASLVYEVD
ncbi:MAG: ATP-grasp domain-containing protein [bacterium]|nr:ATP-grasp domain-containing protein [bacterium]